MGEVAILSVGEGDTKLTFDKSNPAETIRAARIVGDMLRRGYALLVEVEQPDGSKAFQRVKRFDEATNEYIIADFDPSVASYEPIPRGIAPEIPDEEAGQAEADRPAETIAETPAPRPRGRPRKDKRIPATGPTRAVAVARSAGG
jgi:hypothetical protein